MMVSLCITWFLLVWSIHATSMGNSTSCKTPAVDEAIQMFQRNAERVARTAQSKVQEELFVWTEGIGPTPWSPSSIPTFGRSLLEHGVEESEEHLKKDAWLPTSGRSFLEHGVQESEEHLKKDHNVLVDHQRKLAFCYFPKVASAVFNTLFNTLNNLSKAEKNGHHFGCSSPERLGIDMSTITKKNGWKFAFFTRDPLARFLSAFGSKCLPKANGKPGDTHYCAGIVGQTQADGWPIIDHPAPSETMLIAFEQYVVHFKDTLHTADDELVTNNKHYMRQVDLIKLCGSEHFSPKKVDFIGHLGEDVNSQVKDMLELVNKEGTISPEALADEYFPRESLTGHHREEPMDDFVQNEAIKQMVYDMYKPDYDLLGRPYAGDISEYHGPRP